MSELLPRVPCILVGDVVCYGPTFHVVRASLVIPAYNEEHRLPTFLAELSDFHQAHPDAVGEILVVDDGSTDRTSAIAAAFANRLPLRVIHLPENRGKGAAVQRGIQEARGDTVIFMDADGATAPGELPRLIAALTSAPIAVGNRWIPESRVEDRELLRRFSGWLYRTYVGFFGLRGIDTMCGFKGFRTDTARLLFQHLHTGGWLFDTEVMLRARRKGYRITGVPIRWTSKHGSKLRVSVLIKSVFHIPLLAARVWREG